MPNANSIRIKGARVHNLKNINVEIPRDKFVVITGLSGSGKSSLAFDTIYAEGQRRYVESLSAYARQFVGLMDKPDVDSIEGLSPAISIDQKTAPHNPRSTVGTITEIYDYMRLLFARIGVPHCPECGKKIRQYTVDEIVENVERTFAKTNLTVLSPLVKDKKGEHKNILAGIAKAGFGRVRLDGAYYTLDEMDDLEINKKKKHTLEIVIDRLHLEGKEDRMRLAEAIEKALDLSNGLVTVAENIKKNFELKAENAEDNKKFAGKKTSENQPKEATYSKLFACPDRASACRSWSRAISPSIPRTAPVRNVPASARNWKLIRN